MTLQGECFLHDVIVVKSAITEVRRSTFRLCHAVYRKDSLVAVAEMGFAGFDYSERQPGAAARLSRKDAPFDRVASLIFSRMTACSPSRRILESQIVLDFVIAHL